MSECRTEWRPRDTAWVTWVAVLPFLLLAVVVSGALVMDYGGSSIGDVLATWYLLGAFGLLVVVPVALVSLFGAGALAEQFRFGRRLATAGSAAMVLVVAVAVHGVVDEALHPEQRDPNAWGPQLSAATAVVVVLPYLAIAAANVHVVVRLWRPRD